MKVSELETLDTLLKRFDCTTPLTRTEQMAVNVVMGMVGMQLHAAACEEHIRATQPYRVGEVGVEEGVTV